MGAGNKKGNRVPKTPKKPFSTGRFTRECKNGPEMSPKRSLCAQCCFLPQICFLHKSAIWNGKLGNCETGLQNTKESIGYSEVCAMGAKVTLPTPTTFIPLEFCNWRQNAFLPHLPFPEPKEQKLFLVRFSSQSGSLLLWQTRISERGVLHNRVVPR